MRPFRDTISLDEARRLLMAAVKPIAHVERIPLEHACGRVLAADAVAPFDHPPFDRSAMDGYAVRAADLATATRAQPAVLRCIGRSYTAEPFAGLLEPGDCVEIATGAPLPPGADAVIMVEDTGRPGTPQWPAPAWLESADTILMLTSVQPGQHVVRRGADMSRGDRVLRAGAVIDASRLGALAAIGLDPIAVRARPRVAIFPTGNEVVIPGQALPAASVYDVNSYTIAALVAAHGASPTRFAPVRDAVDAVATALDAARTADVIVFAGGSSVGERDVVVDGVSGRGEIVFHGIAVKPGKPTLFARIGTQLVFGMPGNPTSCLSNGHVLLVPVVRALAGLPPLAPERRLCRLASAVSSPRNRHQFLPVRLEGDMAVPTFKGSGEITSLSQADGYVEIPLGVERVDAGEEVMVTAYR
jgi:molybdenum cofactor synthesis domain-containing protein